jgi:hypothetical protein
LPVGPDDANHDGNGETAEHDHESFRVSHEIVSIRDHPHPETFVEVRPEIMGEIVGSGSFFARKFGARSNVGEFRWHRS